ncbi:MAG: hypothetical protein IT207_08625 [Fimbriimonadaceae bacterium]|nr:hypothetical protein [Fimbriimonadaceae bacterium]
MTLGFASLLLASSVVPQAHVGKADGFFTLAFDGGSAFHRTRSRVVGLETIQLGGTSVATWREAGTEMYAVSLDGRNAATVRESSGMIRLKFAEFDPLQRQPIVPNDLQQPQGTRSAIVQFETQPLDEYRAVLENLGAKVTQYLPDDSYVVLLPPGSEQAVRALPFVRWVGAFHNAYRLEAELLDSLAAGTYRTCDLDVQVINDDPQLKAEVVAKAQMVGVEIVTPGDSGTLFIARADATALRRLAGLDGVSWIGRKGQPGNDMDIVRNLSGANFVQANGGFRGSGVNAHDIDAGFRLTHNDFVGHITPRNNPGVDSHGTSTAGIVGGAGVANAMGTGMMPESHLVVTPYQVNWNGAARLALTQDTVNVFNCVVETNSWGDSRTSQYTSISSYMDEIVYKTDLLILNSMSNAGSTQVRPQAWGKNILGVGAVNHFNNTNFADDRWSNGASIGPAADGRIKPELSFFYDSIFCPDAASNTAYTPAFGGTSAATPMTAGACGLFFDMWNEGIFGNSTLGATVFANRSCSALAKAIMVNTARLYPVGQTDINRNVQGWGVPDLQNLHTKSGQILWVNETELLTQLQSKTYKLHVPAGTPEFRATMAYIDYWAAANANPTQVNRLSMQVVSPGGTSYWANNGMSGAGGANTTTPGGAMDTRNNMQNVYVTNPQAGTWTITIKAEILAQDGHPETVGVTDSGYGLAVSGGIPSVSPATVQPWRPGSIVSGGVPQLLRSENSKMEIAKGLQLNANGIATTGVRATSTLPFGAPSKLDLLVEPESNLSATTVEVRYWNYANNDWETVGSQAATGTKAAFTVSPGGDLTRFVEPGTNKVEAAVLFIRDFSTPTVVVWNSKLDHVRWMIGPQ